jgi:hypothetical protein
MVIVRRVWFGLSIFNKILAGVFSTTQALLPDQVF